MFAGAGAGPHERIGAQVALDVGGDDFSRDAFTGHKPLVLPRHVQKRVRKRWRVSAGKRTLMSVLEEQAKEYEVSVTRRGQGSKITLPAGDPSAETGTIQAPEKESSGWWYRELCRSRREQVWNARKAEAGVGPIYRHLSGRL
jgi:hypothetical protein